MKSVLYSSGEIKGGFEIIEKSRGVRAPNGNIRSIYLVICLTCGSKVELDANQMRYRKDCGCLKAKKQKELGKYRNNKKKTIQKITDTHPEFQERCPSGRLPPCHWAEV